MGLQVLQDMAGNSIGLFRPDVGSRKKFAGHGQGAHIGGCQATLRSGFGP